MHAQQPRVDAIREVAPKLNVREDGTLGAEADPEEVVARGDERELFAVWTTYHVRRWIEHVLGTLQGKDDADSERARREFAKDLAAMAPANELHALEANRRLVDLLTGRRWSVMQEAREAGASWAQIGKALRMTKQGAQDGYRRKIEAQAKIHDDSRARAALAD